MSKSTAIVGKGGVGKTFVTVNLAMALSDMGVKTLVVGCDQKRETVRAMSKNPRPSLIESLETINYAYDELALPGIVTRVSDYVDVLELGAATILTGHYGAVYDEAFHAFDELNVWNQYDQLIFDVSDERFDSAIMPLLRKVERAVVVTTEETGSLWVVNRIIRAVLIAAHEFGTKTKLSGVINNRSKTPHVFEAFVEKCRLFPLMTIPDLPELGRLRHFSRSIFNLEPIPDNLKSVSNDFLMLADMARGEMFNVFPLNPLSDEDIWSLSPPVSLPT